MQERRFDFIVDSHCHLNYKGLVEEQGAVIDRARRAGVGCMLAINTKLSEYDDVRAIAENNSDVYATVGIHPHEAENEPDVAIEALLERASHSKTVGIGETGLDYYYDNAPRDMQKVNFRNHIAAARTSGLPVIVHTRDADDDCINMLQAEMAQGEFSGLIHCFTASQRLADACIEMGMSISISGIATFKSAKELQETVKTIPMDKLLVETDAPFLAPVPHRGKTCEPAFVMDTARFVADLKGVEFTDFTNITTSNFFNLFNKIDDSFKPVELA
ncbi:TatD-related deoxyribonuclease [Kordiimonas sediminis]|uniref:TatD-related deoxyribonuclease n=1 Tax=Kordiimonas sediminis TaxID=1735581 RepID=A0A919AXI5_9PROT|nr:TatD family hydrolase [Kordiimonas sediminis]GHF28122.1 TatD-related deoxyribonuclease [Kordiimonas sediminis]